MALNEFEEMANAGIKKGFENLNIVVEQLKKMMTKEDFAELNKDVYTYSELVKQNRHVEAESFLAKMLQKFDK